MLLDGTEPETCRRCGFDSRLWQRGDTSAFLELLGYWWRAATAGVSVADLNRRPAPGVWSALEYALHSAFVLPLLRHDLEVILDCDRSVVRDAWPELDIEDASRPLVLDPGSLLDDLEREAQSVRWLVDSLRDGWNHCGLMDNGTWWQAEATLLHLVHDTAHHLFDVGEGLARLGVTVPTTEGWVGAVARDGVAPGGQVRVLPGGIEGGVRSSGGRRIRPFDAVRLAPAPSSEPAAGHLPAAGADLVLAGIAWASLRPGIRVLAGSVLLEVSHPAERGDPLATDWYAWVRRPGELRAGDRAVVSPEL